ncbi:MAG: hypothetical protein NC218_08270 [Acetobacter sp.]|nr:hypothetical protein [Acetobacter sp.]
MQKVFNCTINLLKETGQGFEPMDLGPYAIRFRVLGSTTADAEVLVEHIITSSSDLELDGQILDSANGNFAFTITAEDTEVLGLGEYPIQIDLLDYDTLTYVDTITQGGKNGEFNKIFIIQV